MKKNIELSLQKAREIYGKSKEMDELLLANFTKEELEKPVPPKCWGALDELSGYFIDNDSNIIKVAFNRLFTFGDSKVFKTEKQAHSALAKAQLSQLMAVYNDGWEADWNNGSIDKFTISRNGSTLEKTTDYWDYRFLAFKSKKIRDEFFKNFEDLIKIYFEL